eukprot:s1251_g17.t1
MGRQRCHAQSRFHVLDIRVSGNNRSLLLLQAVMKHAWLKEQRKCSAGRPIESACLPQLETFAFQPGHRQGPDSSCAKALLVSTFSNSSANSIADFVHVEAVVHLVL